MVKMNIFHASRHGVPSISIKQPRSASFSRHTPRSDLASVARKCQINMFLKPFCLEPYLTKILKWLKFLHFQEDFGFSDYTNDVTNPELNEKLTPLFKKVCWKSRDTLPKCSKCFSSACISHECTRIASVQYAIDSLEREGIADEVVAAILKKRAEKAKSAEIFVHRLNVSYYNGEFGNNPPSTRIDDENIIRRTKSQCQPTKINLS